MTVLRAVPIRFALTLFIAGAGLLAQSPVTPALPPELHQAVEQVLRPTASERHQLLSGQPFTTLLEADPTREVAVFGSVWIDAPSNLYAEAIKDIENFERGSGFNMTGRLSDPPQLEDFSRVRLTREDFEDLKKCRVGDCEIKLGEAALNTLRSEVNWKSPMAKADAERVLRRLLLEYVKGYQARGNAALAVYRDRSKPLFVEGEFRTMLEPMPVLASGMPGLRAYLLDYPNVPRSGTTDVFYWQETEFGLKPTMRISHVVIYELDDTTVVASKMLYASHYFWTALELRQLVADPARGRGFWLVTASRSRCDGLSGFTGTFVRGRVRSAARKGMLAALRATKATLEARAR